MKNSPLPEPVRQALDRPELRLLWQRLHRQLERTGLEPSGAITIPITDHHVASELGAILGRRLTGHIGKSTRIALADFDRILRAGPAQRGVAETVAVLTGQPILVRQVERDARIAANQRLRQELLGLMAGIPELSAEGALLDATPVGEIPHVPKDSASGTSSWPVYEAAVRAACVWWRAHGEGRTMAAKQLAGEAFRDTKKWSDQRRLAFANLAQRPFDKAVEEADSMIKLSGPMVWKIGETVADAAAAHPWLCVPARGIRTLGYVECSARGILLVENQEAFEQVCRLNDITDRWLCVWSQGNASSGLVKFLVDLGFQIAAWCDLDAPGIAIIADLEKRVGRPVTPVGMSVELWMSGIKRIQDDRQMAGARQMAARLSTKGPIALRALAAAIATTGDSCEQETLYEQVLPTLVTALSKLEQGK